MPSLILNVINLSKDYGHNPIFSHVSLQIFEGEIVGLYGQSGSGKSTLGRCITRLEEPSSGKVFFQGQNFNKLGKWALRRTRTQMQMIFQHPETSLNPRMRVIDSLTEPVRIARKCTSNEALEILEPIIHEVGIRQDQLLRYPHQLSGGEIQRAVIAKIFSLNPALIIADEATSMLDVSVQAQVIHLMKKLQEETKVAYLMISHDLELLNLVCTRILKMQDGTIEEVKKTISSSYTV
ncbi:MAG TPA: dipeptide/oligopeptide/nickel ABC transporter ATP-binding protein [Methanospirillum sp.]|uniref:ABC transporter ATP-binding protein n=1 Tax=Methanospirillum sp. TaxID=45200 RepID=UPI002B88CCCB|nr:dipeptide/oligopeptide/nickel ABC transporter ATP-binding protein [Methanospirillum sp.]HWQ64393.1 dipeptide/oligopeptide/nickel ABC transporter ATP-binding protein [Methanospirillum sp.]